MLVFCGIPLFLIELGFGQFSGFGTVTSWRASPMFKGIGFGMMLVSFFVIIYYNVIIAYAFFYLFASYNKFSQNIYRDTLIVALGNCGTSIFAGFVIFSVIGHMAFKLQLPIDKVADQGPGLAFVAYPEAVSLLPAPQLWSILFFFMLITLGLDSQFAMTETVITGLTDEFPKYLMHNKFKFTAFICSICFLLGLLLVTEGGFFWFNLYDWYSAYYGLYFLTIFLCLAITYGYGHFFTYPWRFNKDMKLMLGREPNWYYRINWMLFSPGLLVFITLFSIINYSPITLNKQAYPKWADNLGICMSITVAAVVPLYMVYRAILAHYKGESIKELFKPNEKWGPQDKSVTYHYLYGDRGTKTTYGQEVNDHIPNPYRSPM
uniref:Transporter n=1 Tax=Ciona savignyi TaxID=51511 RepID=H2Z9K1_CIOSA